MIIYAYNIYVSEILINRKCNVMGGAWVTKDGSSGNQKGWCFMVFYDLSQSKLI